MLFCGVGIFRVLSSSSSLLFIMMIAVEFQTHVVDLDQTVGWREKLKANTYMCIHGLVVVEIL